MFQTITVTKLNAIITRIYGEAYQIVPAKIAGVPFYMLMGQICHTSPDVLVSRYDWYGFEIAVADYIMATYPAIKRIMNHIPMNMFWAVLSTVIENGDENGLYDG